jgi:predicted extracellular nuclease
MRISRIVFQCVIIIKLLTNAEDLVISEYVEGSSNNKALEFCNPSAAAVNLATDNFVIQLYKNNSTNPTFTISLTGSVPPGGSFVLAHSSAASAILSVADQTSSNLSYNGDDVVILRKGGASGTIVDSIGRIGSQPNNLADITLRKKSCDLRDIITSDVFDQTVLYDAFAVNTFTNLKICPTSCSSVTLVPTVPPIPGAPSQPTNVPLAPTIVPIDGIVSYEVI